MVAFLIVTKGKHYLGEEPDRLHNLVDGNLVGLDMVQDPAAKYLISWMLSHDPKNRPLAEKALKHRYLQSPPQLEAFLAVDDPQKYFLKVFPNLAVVVHRIVRTTHWRGWCDLKKYFM